jgi:hypothetical protein
MARANAKQNYTEADMTERRLARSLEGHVILLPRPLPQVDPGLRSWSACFVNVLPCTSISIVLTKVANLTLSCITNLVLVTGTRYQCTVIPHRRSLSYVSVNAVGMLSHSPLSLCQPVPSTSYQSVLPYTSSCGNGGGGTYAKEL